MLPSAAPTPESPADEALRRSVEATEKELNRLEHQMQCHDGEPDQNLSKLINIEYSKLMILKDKQSEGLQAKESKMREEAQKKLEQDYAQSLKDYHAQRSKEEAAEEADVSHCKSLVKAMSEFKGKDPITQVLGSYQGCYAKF